MSRSAKLRASHCFAAALVAACASPPSPAPVATPASVALVNPGFESTAPGRRDDPEGWFTFQHAVEPSYRFSVDTVDPHGGARSFRIDSTGPDIYGAIAQSVDAAPHAGKVARYSAWLRTRDTKSAVLTMVALKGGATVSNNFMADAPVAGTTPWTRYTITLPVPANADRIEIGAMLQGKGSLWLDDAELAFVAQ